MDERKKVGGRIKVLEDLVLGTPDAMATIKAVTEYGYIVHIDGDDPEWDGPVDFGGNVLCDDA